jgi:hypothetical protein
MPAMPFPVTIREAEKRIHEQESLSSIFPPLPDKQLVRNNIYGSAKITKDIYESPICRKLKLSIEKSPKSKTKKETLRASVSVAKNNKEELDFESELKVKRTVFKDYKECAKLPTEKLNDRDNIKRGYYTNNIDENDNALAHNPKPKPAPKRIIKKIAESLDAWQATKRLKNSRNPNIGIT